VPGAKRGQADMTEEENRVKDQLHESEIPEHCIRERAFEIYVQRGRKGGHADGDWLTAEAELKELKKKAVMLVSAVESRIK
jgi:hypothetical protein